MWTCGCESGERGDVDVDRAWMRREAKSEGGQGGKLNAGRQLTINEMWGVHRAHLGAHGDVARHDAIFFS